MKTFYVGIKGVIVKEDKVLLLRANGAKGRRDIWEMPGVGLMARKQLPKPFIENF